MIQIIAKNQTGSAVPISTLTVTSQEIPASSQVVLTDWNTITEIFDNAELDNLIDAGTIVLLVDNNQLSKQQSASAARATVTLKNKDVFFNAYENGTTTLSSSPTTVGLDTIRVESDNDLFSLGSGEVTVSESGVYRVTYSCAIDSNSNSRSEMSHWLEINSTELAGTRGYTYHRNTAENRGSYSNISLVELAANDVVRIRTDHVAGATTGGSTIANGSQLTLELIASPQ